MNAMEILDGGRISIAALAVGIAQGAYESAVRYAKERQQFGKPIAEFQAIQFKLADMATQIDAARLLMYRAAWMKDAGKKTTKESSMAKLFASEVSVHVCEEAIQVHGGYGYMTEFPYEREMRDAMGSTLYSGTSEIQRNIIARGLGIPAVVGLRDLHRRARTGDEIVVDALTGEVILHPSEVTIERYKAASAGTSGTRYAATESGQELLRTLDGRAKLRLGLRTLASLHQHPALDPQGFGEPDPLMPA